MKDTGNNIGPNAPDLKLLAELNTILGLSAIKAALSPQPQSMPIPLGQIAYEAYCESRDWCSVNREYLPPWHDQSPDLKAAWDAAALAIEFHLSQPESLSPSGTTSTASAPRG